MAIWNRLSNSTAKERGQQAEDTALRYLNRRGLRLIERNFRCRGGEIDLIMLDGQTLVVIEVRQRRNTHHGTAAETVDHRKQQRIILATRRFLHASKDFYDRPIRFDVVAFNGATDSRNIQWLKDAFEASPW
ncbi:MAG: YraN family protein [Pseudomonadota bacterium]|nr:YraN family protein [Pseudomonadota bacterium]